METTTIEKLKKGDYFRKVDKQGNLQSKVFVFQGYDRSLKKYEYYDFHDFCNYHFSKKGLIVSTDFVF